jgi:TRAP-type mannitol/chloroaromatic compound transport system permease small subunit
MGDLVRFWYAALFLFASASALVEEGHVRVDVLYTGFSRRKKAWFDSLGCSLLGIPICWVILMQGMGGRGNSLNSPLLSFEVSQSGYGMYVKYLMAAFLIVFSVSMMIQFVSYLLYNIAQLREPDDHEDHVSYRQLVSGEGG